MANYIYVFNSISDFYSDIKPLIDKAGVHFYTQQITDSKRLVSNIENVGQITESSDKKYESFYFTSEAFDEENQKSFFEKGFTCYVIEGTGGRFTETEVELISLRLVSKTPDKKIKAFHNRVLKYLKDNEDYGMGVGPVAGSFYKKMFYKKKIVRGKTMWFDFARKFDPITIDVSDSE